MPNRNSMMKLMKRFLERVKPQTKADCALQLKLQRPANFCKTDVVRLAYKCQFKLVRCQPAIPELIFLFDHLLILRVMLSKGV